MTPSPSFLGLPSRLDDGRSPRIVLVGAGHASAYPAEDSSAHAGAADAIRVASQGDAGLREHWDFELGGPLFDGGPICCIDGGIIESHLHDNAGNRSRIENRVRDILASRATPILIGGTCSVTIPFLSGFAEQGPIWVLQIDAHIDWRDEIHGERFGYSSSMRRASEMAHVAGMVQVGLRSVGSARAGEVEAARAYGSHFVTAREIHDGGAAAALRHIPEGAQVVVTLDCDSLDPSVMPGVAARVPGGLSYTDVIDLIAGVSRRGRLAGFNLVELLPSADVNGLSALTASRIVTHAIGAMVRQDKPAVEAEASG